MRREKTLRWNLHLHPDLIWIDKPSGFNTHASDPQRPGLVELLAEELGEPLWVVHRLDQGTSGVLVFARSKEAAARFLPLFERHELRKTYLFLTRGKASSPAFEARSRIEKRGSAFASEPLSAEPNAFTSFRHVGSRPAGELWEASPRSGKPHQIRLHAADAGLAILGDTEHGGPPFHRLALHARALEFAWKEENIFCETPLPAWARDDAAVTLALQEALENRARLFDLAHAPAEECLRLAHTDAHPFHVDRYGGDWWVSLFREQEPSEVEHAFLRALAAREKTALRLRQRQNRGKNPHAVREWLYGEPRDRWIATENGARFELRADAGQSAGLFLDQRENRLWVRENARDLRVLNLFSYTGAFSVNAALGGAREVCTVDVSRSFNDWARTNFALNGLDPASFEFWDQDAGLFLKGALKRGRRWDLIVCDPPSFGRSRDGVFQLAKHLPGLVDLLLEALAPGGRLLLSTNYEEWTQTDLERCVLGARGRRKLELLPAPRAGLDFERPGEEPLMKSLICRRLQ